MTGHQEKIAITEGIERYVHPNNGLTSGAFYWVRMVEGDERNNIIPETSWQPARYTGRAGDSVGDTWDFLGYYSATGHHDVNVMEIGAEIIQQPPETDSDLRERLQDVDRLFEDHVNLAATAIGKELDTLAGYYGLTRRL